MSEALRQEAESDEAALIAHALDRDPRAISAITTRYNRRLFRIARSILKSDEEAEDALQAAYMQAFSSLASFRRESSLATWMTRIVMNVALGVARRRRPTVALENASMLDRNGVVVAFPFSSTIDPERSMAQRQLSSLIEDAIDELPDGFRTVLVARVLEGMTVEETAAVLGITPQTVKTRLHRARRMLREQIERRVGPILMDAFPFDGWRCERMTRRVLAGLGLPQ